MLPSIWRNRGSLIGPSVDDFIERFFYEWPSFETDTDITWSPRVDVNETENDITIDVELPGIDKKDVKVEVKNNVLSISGERKMEKKIENTESSRIERHYGKFERTFGLPDTVEAGKVSAKYKDGILALTLPKTEKAKTKEIAVEIK